MNTLLIIQIVVSIILILLIIPQGHGGGLGQAFGGASYHTRRGLENTVFKGTIIASIIFTIISLANLF